MATTKRRPTARPVLCFLCALRIDPEDMEDAYERVLTDFVPAGRDFAHAACADRAGYFDQPEAEEEFPSRTR
jgi:hypothetical protein